MLHLPFDCVGGMLDLIFVKFTVRQEGKDDDNDEPLAIYCVPLGSLREGACPIQKYFVRFWRRAADHSLSDARLSTSTPPRLADDATPVLHALCGGGSPSGGLRVQLLRVHPQTTAFGCIFLFAFPPIGEP